MLTLEGRKNHYDVLTESLEASCGSLRAEAETIAARTAADGGPARSVRRRRSSRCERERAGAAAPRRAQKLAGQSRAADAQRRPVRRRSRSINPRWRQCRPSARAPLAQPARIWRRCGRIWRPTAPGAGSWREKFRRSNEDAQAEIARRERSRRRRMHAAAQEKQAALDALSQEKLALEARRNRDRAARAARQTTRCSTSEREVRRLRAEAERRCHGGKAAPRPAVGAL